MIPSQSFPTEIVYSKIRPDHFKFFDSKFQQGARERLHFSGRLSQDSKKKLAMFFFSAFQEFFQPAPEH